MSGGQIFKYFRSFDPDTEFVFLVLGGGAVKHFPTLVDTQAEKALCEECLIFPLVQTLTSIRGNTSAIA